MTRLLFLASIGLLAGCNESAPAPAPSPKPTESGYIARVQALAPGAREGVLFRAIQGGGGSACQGIKNIDAAPASSAGQPQWRVTCLEGSQWAVRLADDGTAYVTGARR